MITNGIDELVDDKKAKTTFTIFTQIAGDKCTPRWIDVKPAVVDDDGPGIRAYVYT